MLAGVLGLEPRLFGTRIRRVASYTIPQCAPRAAWARIGMLPTVMGSVNPPRSGLNELTGGLEAYGSTLLAEEFE